MIGIPNELMPGLPSSRMTLKVFYSESVAVLVTSAEEWEDPVFWAKCWMTLPLAPSELVYRR